MRHTSSGRERLAADLVSNIKSREKQLWTGAGLCVGLIYGSAFVARPMTDFLRHLGLLRSAVAVLFVVGGASAVRWILSRRPTGRTLVVLIGVAGVYLLLLLWLYRTPAPEECVHLLEYGLLGGLIYKALVERQRRWVARSEGSAKPWVPAVGGILATALLGWVDEAIQFWLPERYYDARDIALNAAAGFLAVLGLEAIRRTRQQEGESGRPGG